MRHDAIIHDTQTPVDNNGIFDGDSFNDMEFKAWLNTVYTYPRIRLWSRQYKNLNAKVKAMARKFEVRISIERKNYTTLEVIFRGYK